MSPIDKRRLYSSIALLVFLLSAVTFVVWDVGRTISPRVLSSVAHSGVRPEQLEKLPHASVSTGSVPAGRPIIITRAIDGDTVDVEFVDAPKNSDRARVRLIGVNTPESVDPRKPVQCFGKEASAHTTELVAGITRERPATLVVDATQGEYDKYQRLLAYIYLPDGTLLNERIIAGGYGFEYTYRTPYIHQARFKEAEKAAKIANRGLWAPEACSGEL